MQKEPTPEQLVVLVHQFGRQHFTRAHALFEEIGIYRGQPPILHKLWENEGLKQQDLVKMLHLAPATVTKILQRMEQSGLIDRRADPDDQRVTRVFLTEAGREIQNSIQERERQMSVEMVEGFSPEEITQLYNFLTRMRDNLLRVNQEAQSE